MISPGWMLDYFKKRGLRHYTGVPCSYFQSMIETVEEDSSSEYFAAPNEGAALAFASGLVLAGKPAAVMIQNSGLGNLINPLTSLSMIYNIPVLIFISGRAYGIPDEPQHEIMGQTMKPILDVLKVPQWDFPQEAKNAEKILNLAMEKMKAEKKPVALIVKQGTFAPKEKPFAKTAEKNDLRRRTALSIFNEFVGERDLVFSTTGKSSRELFESHDRKGNFYMQGSMGHVGSLALGAALSQQDKKVWVLDGDGACLMHMGALSMIGHYRPKNFFHILIDNGAYETTGNQDTTATSTDFAKIALACGYAKIYDTQCEKTFRSALEEIQKQKGPAFVRVKVSRLEGKMPLRITQKYRAYDITENFKQFISTPDA